VAKGFKLVNTKPSTRKIKNKLGGATGKGLNNITLDRVSGLGEKLQLLAKVETQKLNAAREEGLSLRR
jgi:hypothetical protein